MPPLPPPICATWSLNPRTHFRGGARDLTTDQLVPDGISGNPRLSASPFDDILGEAALFRCPAFPSPMSSRAEALFSDALARPPEQRAAFLAEVCGDDEALQARVQLLLEAHDLPETLGVPELLAGCVGRLEEKPGDVIGRYRLREKIGEGGCGVVFLAEQEQPVRRRVALKVIKAGMDTREVIA